MNPWITYGAAALTPHVLFSLIAQAGRLRRYKTSYFWFILSRYYAASWLTLCLASAFTMLMVAKTPWTEWTQPMAVIIGNGVIIFYAVKAAKRYYKARD